MDLIDYALKPVFWAVDKQTRYFGKFCGFAADKLYEFGEFSHQVSEELEFIARFVEDNA